jgi:hypothetical protein
LVLYAIADGALFRSTDGGDTWSAAVLPRGIRGLAIDPQVPSTLYGVRSDDSSVAVVLKSDDSGGTWQPIPVKSAQGLTDVVVDPVNSSTVYASALNGLFKTTDGGQTWDPVTPVCSRGPSPRCDTYQILAIDPMAPSTLYAAVVESGGSSRGSFKGIFKSTDGGGTWRLILREALWALVVDPTNPSTLYGVAIPGVLKSADGGNTWQVNPLSGTLVQALSLDPTNPSHLYAGAFPGSDAFLMKLDPSGSTLLYSTYIGGSGEDKASAIVVDAIGSAYVAGTTFSYDFPTVNPLQPQPTGRSRNLFVVKVADPSTR